ncbi:MAG: signal peptidase I, partial [Gammaproteobacteria bacterium]|nr:signal peptidase I [Gammaproteobacteria bacterium]
MSEANTKSQPSRLRKFWREWRGFVVFIICMFLFRSAIADWNQVPSSSMRPSILDGDRIVVDKMAYGIRVPFTLIRVWQWSHPNRGDIVTFPSPVDDELFVKRVVGIPGDEVQLNRNRLIINGHVATYTPVPEEEHAGFYVPEERTFRLFREEILDSSRIIMLARDARDPGYASFGPVTLGEDEYLMLGDNRDNSSDFRRIGVVTRDRIIGRAHAVAFSLDLNNYWLPRL